mgnify:CR=1 FL=1
MTRPPERLKNMKLPTATLPANLQEMRRQSVKPLKPLKRLSGRLLKTVRSSLGARSSGGSNGEPNGGSSDKLDGKNPFKAVPSASDVKDSKGSKVLLNLLLVRPWVLVLGFWLLSMAIGTVALSGMLSPRKLKMALPEPALDSGVANQSNTLLNASPSTDSAAQTSAATGNDGEIPVTEVGAANSTEGGLSFPVLPIFALVGSCAAGSLVISRRRAMVRMAAARAQGRKRKSRSSVASGSSVRPMKEGVAPIRSAATASNDLSRGLRSKKRRQRVRAAVTAQSANASSRVLASRATAQQKTAQPRKAQKSGPKVAQKVAAARRSSVRPATRVSRTQARRSAMRAASRRQPMVSVVPASESHALDWTQGSLAHQLDVRPQRSAM